MKKLIFILMFPFIMLGCSKDDSSTPTTKPPVDDKPFANVPDVKDMVMYEVNILAFSNAGNLNGVTAKLDSIKNLGVNVVWLMPTYPIGTVKSVNSPYCVKDYTAVNPNFGNLTTLKTLVSKAHEKNMAVILDWVADHTAWDNSWISNKSWYKQDANGNIISPSTWTDVAQLDFRNKDMRAAMITAMKYWITKANVDGYRCDAADWIPYDFWKQAIDSLNTLSGRKIIMLAEGTNALEYTAGFQMNYGWSFCDTLKNIFKNNTPASNVFSANSIEYSGIPSGKHKLRYTTNHDEYINNTPVTNYNTANGSVAAFVVASCLNGVPLIYSGQEVASSNKTSYFNLDPIDWIQNPDIYSQYRKIMAARASVDAFKGGSIVSYNNHDVVAFKRVGTTDEALVIANVRNKTINYTVPAELVGATYTNKITGSQVTLSSSLSLDAYQYLILKK